MMAGLQRSAVSFRRQGSSGLVWDDKLTQAINQKEDSDKPQIENKEDAGAPTTKNSSPVPTGLTIERSRSNGGGRGFRTGRVSPAIEPPSPKVSACGFCSAFGKNDKTRRRPPKSGKRVM